LWGGSNSTNASTSNTSIIEESKFVAIDRSTWQPAPGGFSAIVPQGQRVVYKGKIYSLAAYDGGTELHFTELAQRFEVYNAGTDSWEAQ
jgi:hypothetical protein